VGAVCYSSMGKVEQNFKKCVGESRLTQEITIDLEPRLRTLITFVARLKTNRTPVFFQSGSFAGQCSR
jgi:hypothetical protein